MAHQMIIVERYNEDWPRWFDRIRGRLVPALAPITERIEHVGSTSVPGLAAKPIIDLDVIVTPAQLEQTLSAVGALGWRHRGELGIVGRHAFAYEGDVDLPHHHLYVCLEGAESLHNHLALRDYLRENPEEADAYGQLKLDLARKFPRDIDAYIAGKTAFILDILHTIGMSDDSLERIRQANDAPCDAHHALRLLASWGAPAHLGRHAQLVAEVAGTLVDHCVEDGVSVDGEVVITAALLHDVGKIVHTEELHQPGSRHEEAGRQWLFERGFPGTISRVCVTHAQWREMDCALEDLLVALADSLWKGKRVEALEELTVRRIAGQTNHAFWSLFTTWDERFEEIAASSDERLRQSMG